MDLTVRSTIGRGQDGKHLGKMKHGVGTVIVVPQKSLVRSK